MLLFKKLTYKLITSLAGLLPLRIISDDGRPYLERYYVGTIFGRRLYLHRFVGSDPKRGWHDHPWYPAYSVVLWGEYGEERVTPTAMDFSNRLAANHTGTPTQLEIQASKVRWFNRITQRIAHRVVIGNDWTPNTNATESAQRLSSKTVECWTLFCHPVEYMQGWGFWKNKHPITNANQTKHFYWYPHDGGDGTRTSGIWWDTASQGKLHPKRVAPLYK